MEEDRLKDLLQSSFEKERNIPFDESAWETLSYKLDKNRRRILPFLWWLFGTFFLMVLLGTWIFKLSTQLKNATARIEILEHSVVKKDNSSIPDTCIENVTIFKYDTIVQTIIIEKTTPKIDKPNTNTLFMRSLSSVKKEVEYKKKLADTPASSPLPSFPYLKKTARPGPVSKHLLQPLQLPNSANTKRSSKLGFEVGLVYGNAPLSAPRASPFPDTLQLEGRQSAQYFALKIGLNLGAKFQINLSPGVERYNYQTTTDFRQPYFREAAADFEPYFMAIRQSSLRIPLELRYFPFSVHRIKPFFEAGIMAHARLKADVSIKYSSDLPYIDPFYEVDYQLSQNAFRVNYANTGVGFIYSITPKINIQLAGQYYFKIKPEDRLHMKYAFQAQMAYKF